MTTCEPGASDVFTQGLRRRPSSFAFFASSPAATRTAGFDVLVQEVMAAITTSPWRSSYSPLPTLTGSFEAFGPSSSGSAFSKFAFTLPSATRSCGRFGPASEGSTVPMSSSSTSVKTGSGELASRHMPCALA